MSVALALAAGMMAAPAAVLCEPIVFGAPVYRRRRQEFDYDAPPLYRRSRNRPQRRRLRPNRLIISRRARRRHRRARGRR